MTVPMTNVPGGDDVNAVVIDIGSSNFRAGFAGEDVPRIMEASRFNVETDDDVDMSSGSARRSNPVNYMSAGVDTHVKSALDLDHKTGAISLDTDILERMINYSFSNRSRAFQIDIQDSPIIMSEPNKANSKYRKSCLDTLFEKFSFPAASLLRRASASAFAVGKQSGLVIDVGASMTSVVPVYDGFVLQKPSVEFPGIGGDLLDTILDELLKKKKVHVNPFYRNTAGVDPKYLALSRLAVVREIKHEVCSMSATSLSAVNGYANWSMSLPPSDSVSSTTLPDGTVVELSPFHQVIPELLFDPSPVQAIPHLGHVVNGFSGIGVAALETIANSDVDIRKAVSSDVILTGGGSLFPGMPDRLLKFLTAPDSKLSTGANGPLIPLHKPKVTASPVSIDRMSSAWLGCSIIASCATFQQLWVSKKQYEEDGFDRVVNRQLFW